MRIANTILSTWAVAFLGAIALLAAAANATGRERPLSSPEVARLMHGETVQRDETLTDPHGHRYVGGVTYTLVDGTLDALARVFDETTAYERILPKTKSARVVGADGPDAFVEIRQGNALAEARYTLRVRRGRGVSSVAAPDAPRDGARELRFWLDPSRPHGIDDAWGFFRYEALPARPGEPPRVLVTFGVLVDLGPGLMRDLFEERVRASMLSVPQRLRAYVAEPARRTAAGSL